MCVDKKFAQTLLSKTRDLLWQITIISLCILDLCNIQRLQSKAASVLIDFVQWEVLLFDWTQ